jgi:hypothetical protein
MVIRNNDARGADGADHVVRHEATAFVVALRIARQQHAEAVSDRDAGADDEKSIGIVSPAVHRIDRLPRDQHGQDSGLAGTRRHLGGDAKEARVFGFVVVSQLSENGAMLRLPRCHLFEPNDGLDGFDLTEEEGRLRFPGSPVIKQPSRLMGHPRLTHRQPPPLLQVTADLVDQRVFGCLLCE